MKKENKHLVLGIFLIYLIFLGFVDSIRAQSPEEILEEFRSINLQKYDFKTVYYKQLKYYDEESTEIFHNYYLKQATQYGVEFDDILELMDDVSKSSPVELKFDNISLLKNYQGNNCGISNYQKYVEKNDLEYFIYESISVDFKKYIQCIYELYDVKTYTDNELNQLVEIYENNFSKQVYKNGSLNFTTKFIKTPSGWKISLTDFQRSLYGVYDSGGYEYSEEENYQEFNDDVEKEDKSVEESVKRQKNKPEPTSQYTTSIPASKTKDFDLGKTQPDYHNNSSTLTDPRDGKTYKTVKIGNQIWMAENLRFKTDNSWVFFESEEMDGESNGRFYTWFDAVKPADKSSRDICPPGWYIPSDADWKKLEITLGMSQMEADGIGARGKEEGKQMKSTYGYGRYYGDNGTNASGFNALLVGYFPDDQTYFNFGRAEKWWSSSEYSASEAWGRALLSNNDRVYRDHYLKTSGFSVRCVYDIEGEDYSKKDDYREYGEEDNTKKDEPNNLIVDLSIHKVEISESVDSDLNDCFAALKIKMNYTARLYENSKFVEYPKGLKIPYIVYLRPIDQSSFETFFNGAAILQNGVPNSDFRFTIGEPDFSIPDNNYEILIKFNSPYKNSSIGNLSRNDYPFFKEVCFESENVYSAKKDDNHENSNKEEKAPVISENEKNFQDALKSMAEKDFKLALSKFKKVYNGNSKSALKKTALISMAECSYQLKKYDETADYLDQFKNQGYLDKENNKTYNALLALSYYRKKKPDYMQGLTHAGSYEINQYPEIYQKDLLYFRAYALDKLKKTELAIEAYEKYAKAFPDERTPKFTKNLDELKYKLIIDNGEHYDYGQAYKRIDFTDKSNQKKILIYEIKNNLFLIKDNNVNGVIMPILLKNAAVGDNFIIDIEPLPIYSSVSVSYLSLEADIPRSKLHIKDFAINLSYNLLKQKDYSDFIYYNHDQSSSYGRVNPEKNKLEQNKTGSVFHISSNSFSNYHLRLHVEVENLGRSLKKLNEFGSKKENSDIYIYLILTSSELSAMKIINDAKEKGKYIQLVGGLGVE